MQFEIEVIEDSKIWQSINFIDEKFVVNVLKTTLKFLNLNHHFKSIKLALLLTDNAHMQSLNKQFLNKEYPTNVLSFPEQEILPEEIKKEDVLQEFSLGDIAFGYEILHKESIEYNVSFQNHFTHLLVHGILHLLGYDHNTEYEWDKMTALEIKILQELNIETPPIYAKPLE